MKKVISCVIFCALLVFFLSLLTEFLMPKATNRYYMLEKYLEENPEQNYHDVQVFGSCHAYTSFNPVHLEEQSTVSAFVYGNPGEIIPVTYLRMLEQFETHTPKVALVEIWGINPYDTYDSVGSILGGYLLSNLERIPFSRAKLEVINDFEKPNFINMNFTLVTYKERLTDGTLNTSDYDYSFAKIKEFAHPVVYKEMVSRLLRNGFKCNPSKVCSDYPDKQSVIREDGFTEINPVLLKYVQKIIDLCKEKGVELIFYRSPYISSVGELERVKHMQQICEENDVLFLNLEAEIEFDYKTDFYDYEHLSEVGANRATAFLQPYILEAMEK